jgi:hypothetical protein
LSAVRIGSSSSTMRRRWFMAAMAKRGHLAQGRCNSAPSRRKQAPSPKLQAPEKSQIPNPKRTRSCRFASCVRFSALRHVFAV